MCEEEAADGHGAAGPVSEGPGRDDAGEGGVGDVSGER